MPAYSQPDGDSLGSAPQTAAVLHNGSRLEVAVEQPAGLMPQLLDSQLPPIFLRPLAAGYCKCAWFDVRRYTLDCARWTIAFHAAIPTVLFLRTPSRTVYIALDFGAAVGTSLLPRLCTL